MKDNKDWIKAIPEETLKQVYRGLFIAIIHAIADDTENGTNWFQESEDLQHIVDWSGEIHDELVERIGEDNIYEYQMKMFDDENIIFERIDED